MSYQKEKACKYECGMTVTWRGKSGKPGSTGFYEKGTNLEHTYDRCRELKTNKGPQQQLQPNYQTQVKPNPTYRAESSTFSRDEEPKATGVTPYSLLIKLSDTKQEVKELRKQIETLASIVDSMAQKQDLMINKIGYPKPEPAIPVVQVPKKDESGVVYREGEEIKAIQRHPTPEELSNALKPPSAPEVINPMRVQKPEDVEDLRGNQEELGMYWETISEAFVCHNCEAKTHNGFMKLGTKLCEPCKLSVEANESEDEPEQDRSDVNNYKPRTIEDINDEI